MIPIKMWNDGNELNKPQNSSQFNKNTVFSKETSSIHNEYGFRIIYEYNVLTQSDLEPIGFIPLIANKVAVFSVVNNNPDYTSEIGIIDNDIYKFDSSMLGIGGCPFAEDKALGNISTVELISFLKCLGYCKEYDLLKLKYIEQDIKNILNYKIWTKFLGKYLGKVE